MKKIFKIFLSYILPLGIGIGLFWYVVISKVSISELLTSFQDANYYMIMLSFMFGIISHWARAYRWKYLLEPLGYNLNVSKGFVAVMVGYFLNLILPRMGEVSRCAILQKMDGVPTHTSFGTVVTERIIDLFILIVLIITILFLEFNHLGNLIFGTFLDKFNNINDNLFFFLSLGGIGIAFLGIGYWIYLRLRDKLRTYPVYTKISTFLKGIWEGVKSVRYVRNKPAFIFYTLLIWVMYYWMAYILFFCFPDTSQLGMLAGLSILIMGGIGMAAPVQGGIGTYHILVSKTLAVYGLSEALGITFAAFMHAMQSSVVVIIGGGCFVLSLFIRKSKPLEKIQQKV